jgi:hypothetical protein
MVTNRYWRPILAGLLALTAVAGMLAILLSPASEPIYQGKKLTVWLGELNASKGTNDPAAQAVRGLGTNALPTLIRLIDRRDYFSTRAQAWLQKIPLVRGTPARDQRWQVVCAFKILGPLGAPAARELSAILEQGRHPGYAASCLAAIGLSGLPGLTQALGHKDAKVRFSAASALGGLLHEAQPAVPQLRARLADPVGYVREAATNALRRIAPES